MPTLFRKQLRRWRKARSQEECAILLGVPVATYRNWEQGRNEPSDVAMKAVIDFIESAASKVSCRQCADLADNV
jgi:DNA-binding transcriptional regulator YiaG